MQTKKCSRCGKIKPLSEFAKDKSSPDGMLSSCKECINAYVMSYYRSRRGVAYLIYKSQTNSSKRRNYDPPDYTKEKLLEWLLNHPKFENLYQVWIASGYNKMNKPSVDRLNDYEGYNFNNIQLITWEENLNKYRRDSKNGINNKCSKAVLQYDLQGNFIKEYYSMRQAERKNNIKTSKISDVCRGYRRKSAGGFLWKFKDE